MAERIIVDIGPLLEDLKKELKDLEGSTEALTVEEAAEDEIEELKALPVIDPERMIPAWRDPDKDPPKVETEVLVLYRNEIGEYGITTAIYENGNIFSEDSEWFWSDISEWETYDEEPPKEEDGDCCGRVLIAHAGAHCAVATSLQYARENPEAVRVWMPLPKLPWEAEK